MANWSAGMELTMNDAKPRIPKVPASGRPGGLNSEIQSRIGHQLRAMYEDVVRQGVPDRFSELIKKLDSDTPSDAGNPGGGRD